MKEEILCSEFECKRRCANVEKMTLSELEKYNEKCCHCGDWIMKTNSVANKTYNAISNRWADEYMKKIMGKKD